MAAESANSALFVFACIPRYVYMRISLSLILSACLDAVLLFMHTYVYVCANGAALCAFQSHVCQGERVYTQACKMSRVAG
jgi:hypothetical protein